ncbi:hypothetical protein LTR95_003920 [Oleoguttula sp. CCFEE 5521]
MLSLLILTAWTLTALNGLAHAGVSRSHVALGPRLPVEAYSLDAHLAPRHAALVSPLRKRDQEYKANLTLDRTFNDLTLISFQAGRGFGDQSSDGTASVSFEITCVECYIKGQVTGDLLIDGNLNISQLAEQTLDEVTDGIKNITDSFVNQTEAWAETVWTDVVTHKFDALALPTYNETSLDLPDLTPLPNTTIIFGFGGVELFLKIKTSLSQLKYQLPVVPKTPVPGWGLIVLGVDLGLYFSMDLILTADAEIDITSGVHLKIGEDAALHANLFGSDVSQIIFNGGQFEFLPIEVHTSAGSTLNATLRVGLHAGFSDNAWSSTPAVVKALLDLPTFQGGIDGGVFADVAEFVFRMTETPEDPSCQVRLDQEYTFAIGASAGASVEFSKYSFGPTATTATPFWSTTLANVCVEQGTTTNTPAITPSPTLARRQDAALTATTISTTFTNVVCEASVAGVCPASLQSTLQFTSTLVTSVLSGVTPTWPGPQIGSVITSAFGSDVHPMTSPSTLIPTSISSPVISDLAKADSWIHQHWRQLAIGLGAGVGGLLLAIILGCCIFASRKKKRSSSDGGSGNEQK